MSQLLIPLLGILLLTLFVSSWRLSLLGLSCQGLLMGWIAYRTSPDIATAAGWLTLFDLVVVRGLAAPLVLYRVLRTQDTPARNDVLPPNLLSWIIAFAIVLVAFRFSQSLVPAPGDERTLIAVVVSGLLLGFLVLATQVRPFNMVMAALLIENAIALFELGGGGHEEVIAIQIGQVLVVGLTIAYYCWYIASLAPGAQAQSEGPLAGEIL